MKDAGLTRWSKAASDYLELPHYFKVVKPGGRTLHQKFQWPMPQGRQPGEWVRAAGDLVMCGNGVHAARLVDLSLWCSPGCEAWEVELDEDGMMHAGNKVCARAGRLVRRVASAGARMSRTLDEAVDSAWDLEDGMWGTLYGGITVARRFRAVAGALFLLLGAGRKVDTGMVEQLLAEVPWS